MTRGIRLISRSKTRLTLAGVLVAALIASLSAIAYWTTSGTGTGSASTGTLTAPSITSAAPGSGTVALTWSTVTPPGSPAATYYVQRDGGNAAGDCPTSASPTGVTSCTDSGLSAGTYDYTVTAVWRSWTGMSATSTVTVTAATLDHFTIAPASGTQTAGTPFTVTVTAKDSSNNTITSYTGTIHFTSNDGAADLPADYTFTTGGGNDNGVHTFTSGVTLKTAGTGKTVTVADGGATGTGTYTVVHGAASQIALTGLITDLASGSPRTFTATIQDANGNTVDTGADSTVSVSFAQTAGAGSVTGTGSSPAIAGVATKSLTGDVAGSVTVRASATLLAGATNSNIRTFNVVAGAATQIALTGGVTDLGSGSARTFTATVKDAAGNTVTTGADSTVSVSFAQTAGTGSVSGTGSSAVVVGVATQNLTGVLTGSVTVRATASLSGPGPTNSNTLTFNVVASAATKLAFTTSPSGSTGGVAFTTQPVVTVQDASGNTVTTDTSSVTLALTTPAGATLTCTSNPLAAVAGVATFAGCKVDLAGTYTLTATDGALTSALSSSFTITVGTAAKLAFTQQPSGSTGGVAFGTQPKVAIQDAGGNTVTGNTSSVTLALTTPAGATLTCTSNPLAAVAGVATFAGCKVDLAGTYTLTATDGALTSALSSSFTITVGTAAKLAFTQQPSGSTGGVAFGTQPKVAIQDAGGNTVTGNTSSVTLALTTPAGATLSCTTNPLAAVAGVGTFAGCKVDLAGTYTLTATDGALTSALSSSFTITVGTAAKLAFTQQPSGSTGGVAFGTQPKVAIQDAGGNTVTGNTSSVTLALTTPAGATLSCTTNPLAAVAGVGTFAGCKVDLAGTYTLTATDGALTSALSSSFTITVGTAAKLAFTQQPSGATGGVAFTTQPVVTVQDAGGNTVTGDTSNVTLAITGGTGTAGAALTCTANPKVAVSGVATFAGCKIDKAGTGYTLTATDGVLTSAVSTSFNITAGATVSLVLVAASTTPTAGVADNLTITAVDAGANTVTSYTGDKTLTFGGAATIGANVPTVSNKTGVATNFGTATIITFGSGVATVSGANNGVMKLFKAETASITVTDGSINNGAGLSVTVTAAAVSKFAFASTAVSGAASSTASLGPATVEVQDSFGNPKAVAANTTVNLASNSTGTKIFATTLNGTGVTSVTVTTGNTSVNFFYGDTKAGSPVITASGTLTSATQTETITAASASVMKFVNCSPFSDATCSGQPIAMGNNSDMAFSIQTQDAFGNPSAPSVATSITFTNTDGTFTISAGSPATITSPATTSGLVTLHHGVNGGTTTLTAHATSGGFSDITLTAKK